jgi:hypothetical protein
LRHTGEAGDNDLVEESQKVGLRINIEKTKAQKCILQIEKYLECKQHQPAFRVIQGVF